jgi:hypothetical protein
MGRPRKPPTLEDLARAEYGAKLGALVDADVIAPLPARHLLPALLAKAKADGDQALIDRILAACSE